MPKCRLAVVGCGEISGNYLKNITGAFGHIFDVAVCADLVIERAERRTAEFNVPRACRTVEEALEDDTVEAVLNLTNPQSHAPVSLAAVRRGRHVYCEKPFAVTRGEAAEILRAAGETGAWTSGAPDTVLGASTQTARMALDSGVIGKPVAAMAAIPLGSPIEGGAHPNADSFVLKGGEALMDMGPYYVSALVTLLGPVERVTGFARLNFPEGAYLNPKVGRYLDAVPFGMPMTAAAVLEHGSGALSTLIVTKEAFGYFPRLEVFGTDGVLHCGDPNNFDSPVAVTDRSFKRFELPMTHLHADTGRGLGIAEMMAAKRAGRPARASGAFAAHVLDVLQGVYDASQSWMTYTVQYKTQRPEPMPAGFRCAAELLAWK